MGSTTSRVVQQFTGHISHGFARIRDFFALIILPVSTKPVDIVDKKKSGVTWHSCKDEWVQIIT
jgi:hypothetical protein